MPRIVCLHAIPKKIVSYRRTQFTSHFWQQLHEALGTHLKFNSAYHPQTDGQTERTNQILKDMLRACALQDKLGWDKRLPYAEFSYNNSYQASLKMSPLQALWQELSDLVALGPTWQNAGVRSRHFTRG
jgi:transposase InsO family protein